MTKSAWTNPPTADTTATEEAARRDRLAKAPDIVAVNKLIDGWQEAIKDLAECRDAILGDRAEAERQGPPARGPGAEHLGFGASLVIKLAEFRQHAFLTDILKQIGVIKG